MREIEDKLSTQYHTFLSQDRGVAKSHSLEAVVDLEKQERRRKIMSLLEENISLDNLYQKLSSLPNKEAVSGEKSLEYMGEVLGEGLFGCLPDETLLADVYPQGEDGIHSVAKITNDPLWMHVSKYLSSLQKANVVATFIHIERFTSKLEDEKVGKGYQAKFKHKQLVLLGDARLVTDVVNWTVVAGIAMSRGKMLINAFRKRE